MNKNMIQTDNIILSKNEKNFYFRLNRLLSAEHMGELFRVIFASKQKKVKNLGFF